jgi:hypothetical protein
MMCVACERVVNYVPNGWPSFEFEEPAGWVRVALPICSEECRDLLPTLLTHGRASLADRQAETVIGEAEALLRGERS